MERSRRSHRRLANCSGCRRIHARVLLFRNRSRPEPAFLIIKPFRTETAKAAISQTLFFDVKALRRRRAVASG